MYRKYLIVFLSLLLLSSFCAVSAFADDPSGEGGAGTGTDVLTDLTSGWYDSSYGYKSGYGTSWFWRVQELLSSIRTSFNDLKSGWTSSSYPTGYAGSWFQQMLTAVRGISSGSSSWTSAQASSVTSDVDGIYTRVGLTNSWLSQITDILLYDLASPWTSTQTSSVTSDVDSIDTNVNTIKTYSQTTSTYASSIDTKLNTTNGYIDDVESKLDTSNSHLYSLKQYLLIIRNAVNDIKTVFASSNAISAHNNQVSNAGAVVTDFLSGSSSSSSLGVSDVHGIKSVVSLGDTYLSSSASISDAPDAFASAFSSSGGLGFWSQEVADELNGVQQSERGQLRVSEPDIVTNYYQQNQQAVLDFFNRGGDQR